MYFFIVADSPVYIKDAAFTATISINKYMRAFKYPKNDILFVFMCMCIRLMWYSLILLIACNYYSINVS